MITTSMNSLTDDYKLINSQLPPDTTSNLLMNHGSTTALYNNNNNNGIIVDNPSVVVPDLLVENNSSNSNSNSNSSSDPSSAEEAVFLPTYAMTLPTTKLEEEPNPFEQSFEATTKIPSPTNQQQKIPVLPSANSIDNPKLDRLNVMENQWDSLRSGILSPSMLPGPAATTATTVAAVAVTGPSAPQVQAPPATTTAVGRRPVKYDTTTFYNHTYENPPPTVNRNLVKHIRSNSSSETTITNKRQKKSKSSNNTKENTSMDPEDEEKRKNFLERNRIAALKCRQRKKQWLQNLQTKVEYLAADNEQYHMQANALREELINLKTLLMAHKDCPINQQELKVALNRPIPGVPNLPHLLSSPMDENNHNEP